MNSNASPARGHGRGHRLRRGSRLAAVVVCLAAFAAACGGPGGTANPGYVNGTPDSGLQFAQCMRAHGVSNVPDPSGGQLNLSGVNQNSPQFQHAAAICGRSAGDAAAQEAEGLAEGLVYSRCMRAHGVRNYPDPVANGRGGFTDHASAGSGGVDPRSPLFQAAARACRSLRPGGGNHGSGRSA